MSKLEWQASETRLRRARGEAEEIVARLGLEAPIDPLRIVGEEGPLLRAKGGDFRNQFDGQLEYHRTRRRFILLYNTKYDSGAPRGEHHPRTRFSIAHELGHYFLERHRAHLLSGGEPHPSQSEIFSDVGMEREADAFASGLLLPGPLVAPIVNSDELTLDRIEEVAIRFAASRVSTALRCVQLSHFPCAVVGVRAGTVVWSFCSQAMIDAGLYPPEHGSPGSPTCAEQWQAFVDGRGEKAEAAGLGRQWFRTYDRSELQRVHVAEHYLPVPKMATLLVFLTVPEEELEDDDE